jgi:hypothetical protein
MRRLLLFVAAAVVGACGDSPLAPVQTVDGSWSGLQNGYSLSLVMVQSDSVVSGSALVANVAGANQGTLAGTFVYPTLHLTLSFPGFDDVKYDGTMSQAEAKIFGHMNGSGLTNVEMDVKKK